MRSRLFGACLAATLPLLSYTAGHAAPTPAPTSPPATHANEIQPPDPYRWLETASPERLAWIRAQNRYSRGFLKERGSRPLVEEIFRKIGKGPTELSEIKVGDSRISIVNLGLGLATQVKKTAADGSETVLFDSYAEKPNGSMAVVELIPSPDAKHLIVSTAANGSIDNDTLHVFDVSSGQALETVTDTHGDVVWVADDEFIYSALLQHDGIFLKHKIGRAEDTVYSRAQDPELNLFNEEFGDGTWFFEVTEKRTTLRKIGSSDKYSIGKIVRHAIGLRGNDLYFITSGQKKKTGQIERVHLDSSASVLKSEVVVPEGPMALRNADIQGDFLVSYSQMGAAFQVEVRTLDGAAVRKLVTPPCCAITGVDYDHEKDQLSIRFRSQIRAKVLTYDFATRSYLEGDPELQLLGGNGVSYISEVVEVTSANSAQVPVRITYKRGLKLNGENPALIEGYGGFGIAGHFTPASKLIVTEFINRGGVYVAPALRGGNELGERWHRDGMMDRKQNVFNDMIATAEYVIARGYTSPSRLALMGASNGGLLVSAVATQRPDLFRLAIPIAGVHDMLRKERLNPEYEDGWSYEYGTSDKPEDYKALLAYSPVHNAKAQAYPTFLIMVGENDSRVNPAHSYKMAAVLQKAQTGPNPILLSTYKNAGHFMTSIARQGLIGWRTSVAIWSTIFDSLGVNLDPLPAPSPTPAPITPPQ